MNKINDPARLKDLHSFGIKDSPSDKDMDELNELASAICNTPIAFISIMDKHRQWYMSKKGLEISEVPIEDSFCQYTLNDPDKVMEVPDTFKDHRLADSKFVTSDPGIRFYVGVPLVSSKKNVIGTLCVADNSPKDLSDVQRNALRILASRVMDQLELQKKVNQQNTTIKLNTSKLIKITENVPNAIFELRLKDDYTPDRFMFISKAVKNFYPAMNIKNLMNNPGDGLSSVMSYEYDRLKSILVDAVQENKQFQMDYMAENGARLSWHSIRGKVEQAPNGLNYVYGSIIDVSKNYEYKNALDQVLFEIPHMIRQPILEILNNVAILESDEINIQNSRDSHLSNLKKAANELDEYSVSLTDSFTQKKKDVYN